VWTEVPGGGGRGKLYITLHYHHQNDSYLEDSDESDFNASLIMRNKVRSQCPQTTTFEERGEPKWNQSEVLLLTSLMPLPLGQAGSYSPENPGWLNLFNARLSGALVVTTRMIMYQDGQ